MLINLRAGLPALILGSVLAIPSFAASVTGQAFISAADPLTDSVTVTPTNINFGTGAFIGFGNYTFGTGTSANAALTGTLASLTGPPLTGAVSVPDFALFNVSGGTIHFDITDIPGGFGSAANCGANVVGTSCTPPGSPFTLTQTTSNSVAITLTLDGIAYLNTMTGSGMSGAIFTTQDIDITAAHSTITGILASVASGGFNSTYSATFFATPTTTPEPASLLLMGIGLLGAGVIARKKIRS